MSHGILSKTFAISGTNNIYNNALDTYVDHLMCNETNKNSNQISRVLSRKNRFHTLYKREEQCIKYTCTPFGHCDNNKPHDNVILHYIIQIIHIQSDCFLPQQCSNWNAHHLVPFKYVGL